ncbi:MAG: ABC transporter ATP-binding protein, partial [Ilumatobacteraceae bacterium]|nr:ABC transporter ATP-binding protein [Ilumatobacteraceae bacterium]
EFGEVTAILGPNGAGKTSTIETCEGYRAPTSGSVQVLQKNPFTQRTSLHSEVGVMLQEGGVYPSARVHETIAQYCALYNRGVDPATLLTAVDLESKASSTWRRLSGGEKQRMLLALALAARPRVAFLDEPTSGVDINGRDAIRHIVNDLAANGTAVVLATHELDEAERLAQRVVLFHHGKIVANAPLATMRSAQHELRFSSSPALNVQELSAHIGLQVVVHQEHFVVRFEDSDSAFSSELVQRVSTWLNDKNLPLNNLSIGAQRLEDIFRHLTGGTQ